MNVQAPSPQTTLFILLGAHEWPYSPTFTSSKAFSNAAQRLTAYLLRPQFFGLPSENLLDLFNSPVSASEQLEQISIFLEQRIAEMKSSQKTVSDVVIYFIGHGAFAGQTWDFYLVHRRTNVDSLRASGISIAALADILLDKARHTRRYVFLDCCFAAAAFKSFQGGPDQVALTKTLDAFHVPTKGSGFPGKGTVLLCSSDQKVPSLLLPDESCTMFTRALLEAFVQGDAKRSKYLSLRDIKELALDWLSDLPSRNAPRPALLSPDQSEGDVAEVPIFPNLAIFRSTLPANPTPRPGLHSPNQQVSGNSSPTQQTQAAVHRSSFINIPRSFFINIPPAPSQSNAGPLRSVVRLLAIVAGFAVGLFVTHFFLTAVLSSLSLVNLVDVFPLSRRSFPNIYSFISLLTIGICFHVGFWPWMLGGIGLLLATLLIQTIGSR
jgi:hypothetical protein